MSLEWYHVALATLIIWMCRLDSSAAGPFPEHVKVLPSTKFFKTSAVATTPIFVKRNDDRSIGSNDRLSVSNNVNMYRLPPSPANLLKPDGFQFYTYNERGDMITKQMTPEEIQALIASGGPDHSNTGIQEPQKVEDILTGGKKVMDVVEKVQNVLKSAMNKPSTLTGTIPNSVPEKANVEWTNILPVILAGEKHGEVADDNRYVERFTMTSTTRNDFSSDTLKLNTTMFIATEAPNSSTTTYVERNEGTLHYGKNDTQQLLSTFVTDVGTTTPYTEKFMIPVAVITAEQKPQNVHSSTQSLVFQKITEIMPSGDTAMENYKDNNNRLTSNGYINYGGTESLSGISNSTTSMLYSPTVQIEMTTVTTNVPKVEEKLNVEPVTGQASSVASSKIETLLSNDLYTTTTTAASAATLDSSKIFDANSDATVTASLSVAEKLSGIESSYATTTKSNYSDIMSSSTSLPIELINSLSSMMDQVSEVSASSILPLSSDFQRETIHSEIEEGKNSSELQRNATATITGVSTTLSTIVGNTFDEQIEESVATTISAKLQGDQNRVTWTIPPVTWSKLFTSANRTQLEGIMNSTHISTTLENTTSKSTLSSMTDAMLTATPILIPASSDETHAADNVAVPNSVTFQSTDRTTTIKPFVDSSMKTNTTGFNILSKVSDIEQQSLAIVESMLETVSTETNTPSTQALVLPNILPENLPSKTVASGLIAGFGFIHANATGNDKTISHPSELAPTNVTTKSETQAAFSVTETPKESSTWYIGKGDLTNENETRDNFVTNKSSYVELVRPSNLDEKAEAHETANRTVSSTHTNLEYIKTEKENEISVKPNSVYMVSSTNSPANLTVINSGISSSDDVDYATTVSNKTSNHSSNVKIPLQEIASNVDGITETSVSKFEGIPLEALKKADATSVIDSDNLDSISSTKYTIGNIHDATTVYDRLLTKPYESALSNMGTDIAAATATTASGTLLKDASSASSSSMKKETNDSSNGTVDTNSIATESNKLEGNTSDISNKKNSMEMGARRNETKEYDQSAIKTNYLLAEIESKSNVTHNLLRNETNEDKNSNVDKLNTTDNGNSESKWQRITLHESVTTVSTRSVGTIKEASRISESTSISTSMSTATSTSTLMPTASTIQEGNSTKEDTRYQTTPGNEGESMVTLNPSKSTSGLDSSIKNASNDIVNFSRLCNELAFKFWIAANKGLSTGRSLALSPFGMVSLLAMIFLGARGSTSDQMNEVLGLDNVATFNPHLIFQNVTDAVSLARHQGIANAAFVRELFADKVKVRKLLPFYKEQAQQFYEGLVAEVNFATISDLARRRTNLLIRKQTGGRIRDFVKSNAVPLRSPLAAISANVFQTDCNSSLASATGRDGELYFATSSAHRLRKLIPVPATVWRSNVLAGYEPSLDATAIGLGGVGTLVSTIFLLPGQQGHAAPGDTLDRLEQRLVKGAFRDGSWNKLLKVLIPRRGVELQIPKFSHRSVVNATAALKRMGLDQLFTNDADFKGINGIGNRLFLSDVLQMNLFSTCGDENTANGRHHVEIYPASPLSRNFPIYDHEQRMTNVQEELVSDFRARNSETQAENRPRLKLDQPFLYFVRHNPTGLILHMGRFNPRLL